MSIFFQILASVTAIAIMISKVAEAWLALRKLRQETTKAEASVTASKSAMMILKMIFSIEVLLQIAAVCCVMQLLYWVMHPPFGDDRFSVESGIALLIVFSIGPKKFFVS